MRENEKQTATRDRYEDLAIHCRRRALSHQHAGDYEQRLQRAAKMIGALRFPAYGIT